MRLYECTLALLRNRSRQVTLKHISNETDLKMSWLVSMSGKSPPRNPSVNMVQTLYSYLAGEELTLVGHEKNGHTARANGS